MNRQSLIVISLLAFMISTLVVFACDSHNPSIVPERLHHMMEVRERLQNELGEQYNRLVPAATDYQLQRGRKLYGQLCGGCHGPRGDGKGHVAEGLA
ncbi:MAG TPA: hypothetical protein VGA99_06465, partial [bacterium]